MSNSFVRRNSADQEKKLDAEKLSVEGLEVYRLRTVLADSAQKAIIYEDVGGGVAYVGAAEPGTSINSPSWRIKQILTTGANLRILWADGDSSFDNVWADRAGLTYT